MEKKEKKKSSGEWINELQYLSTMEYYIVLYTTYIKKNKILSFAATWMNLEIII